MDRIPETEVAKMAKKLLQEAFPQVKFSVRSEKYSGGSSIDVKWNNGPCESKVQAVAGHLKGADFDGMQDLKTYNGRPYANDYIHFNRHVDDTLWLVAMQRIAKERFGLDLPAHWQAFEREYNGQWLANIINAELHKTDF